MTSRLGRLVALAVVMAACTGEDPVALDPISPEPWSDVSHPVVAAVRSSAAVQPSLNAIDGSLETSWESGLAEPQWIEFDLGEPVEISRIRLTLNQSSEGHSIHRVHAGAHDNPGRLAATLEGEFSDGDVLEAAVGYEVEFIRILTTDSPSSASWAEIEIEVSS